MEHIILWIIGILIYLAIGFGVMGTFHVLREEQGNPQDTVDVIYCILGWPVELGSLIGRASCYLQSEMNSVYGFHKKPFKENLLGQIADLRQELWKIEVILNKQESITQKDNDKKD